MGCHDGGQLGGAEKEMTGTVPKLSEDVRAALYAADATFARAFDACCAVGTGNNSRPWSNADLGLALNDKADDPGRQIANYRAGSSLPPCKRSQRKEPALLDCKLARLLVLFGWMTERENLFEPETWAKKHVARLLKLHEVAEQTARPKARKKARTEPASQPSNVLPTDTARDRTLAYLALRLPHLRKRLGPEASGSADNFVSLTLQPLGRGKDGEQPSSFDELREMLESATASGEDGSDEPIWQLRGAPGAGKSTLLHMLELTTGVAAQEHLAARRAGRPELCVRVSLASMPAPQTAADVETWIAQRFEALQPRGRVVALADLVQVARLRFLIDGVNEVQGGTPTKTVRVLAAWASGLADGDESALGPVFTVRTLNYLSFPDDSEFRIARVADVEPWNEKLIEEYCNRRRNGAGESVWPRIAEHPRRGDLIRLFGNPFNLVLQCAHFQEGGGLAANRGELLGRIALRRLRDAVGRNDLSLTGLLGERDPSLIDTLCIGKPDAALHHLPPMRGDLLRGLRRWAHAVHAANEGGRGRWADDAEIGGIDPTTWQPLMEAAASLGLSGRGDSAGTERGASDLRWSFAHHLWQEYLAACALVADEGAWRALDLVPEEAEQDNTSGWQLAAPRPITWDQTVELAVQIAPPERAAAMLQRLTAENPALAGRAALALGDAAPAAEVKALKPVLLARCTSLQVPTAAARIEAGLLLGELDDDLRYERRIGRDGIDYLWPRRHGDQPGWVPVAPGRHLIGGLEDDQDSMPICPADMPSGLALAFAPVTNAEFRLFVQQAGYGPADPAAEPPAWWQELGDEALAWWRGERENQGLREWWQTIRRYWGQDWIRNDWLRNWTDAQIEREIAPYADPERADDDVFNAHVDADCKAEVHRLPFAWGDRDIRNPLQPVTGVCLWEALAYCRWLSYASGVDVRLPTEAEWEAGVRSGGQHGAHWPGTDKQRPERGLVNNFDLKTRRPSPVGAFGRSRTANGMVDTLGNVWEWTVSEWTPGALNASKANSAMEAASPEKRALRGGSWVNVASDCRAAIRLGSPPDDRYNLIGFRLAVCPIQNPEP
jgi:formylglycine-generating enzyme required for sulfatase activity